MKQIFVFIALATSLSSMAVSADTTLRDLGVKPDNRPDYARPGKAMNAPPKSKRTSQAVDNAVQTWKNSGQPTPIMSPGPGVKFTIQK